MTQVRFPAPAGQPPLATMLTVRLVTANGRPALGWQGTRLIATVGEWPLDRDLVVELVPQARIARPDGEATWYAVALRTWRFTETYRIQVPDVAGVVELADLVAAVSVPTAEILAELMVPYLAARDEALAAQAATAALLASAERRLLPDPAGLPDGTLTQVMNEQWVVL